MKLGLFAGVLAATVALHGCTKKTQEAGSKVTEAPVPAAVADSPVDAPAPARESEATIESGESLADAGLVPADESAAVLPSEEEGLSASGSEPVAEAPADSKENLTEALSTTLAVIDGKIAELTAKLESQGDRAKKTWTADLAELKAKRELAAGELAKLKETSVDTWSTLKDSTQSAFEQLEAALKKAEEGVAAH